MRVTIIGGGMASARLIELLAPTGAELTVFSAEPTPPYNRVMLSALLAGDYTEADLALPAPAANVDLRLGVKVDAVDLAGRNVQGEPYDVLVLATGAQPIIPPVAGLVGDDGLPAAGVSVFRTIDDCRTILKQSAGSAGTVLLGGGVLGIEVARGLAARGEPVTIVHAAGHLMDRQLTSEAGAMLACTMAAAGIDLRLTSQAVAYDGTDLLLADGDRIAADTIVVACGVHPNAELAAHIGLEVDRGVVVDDDLRTSAPHVYAIGDCAEHRQTVSGLVGPAWAQAEVLARRLAGNDVNYLGNRPITRLKAGRLDLAVMGEPDGTEVITYSEPARGGYTRLVIDEDRLTGVMSLGPNPAIGDLINCFTSGRQVPDDRRQLLVRGSVGVGSSTTAAPDEDLVCQCNSVTRGDILASGATTESAIAKATRATTGCGGCLDRVAVIAAELSSTDVC